jgi:iron complex outermembrane receptor protein
MVVGVILIAGQIAAQQSAVISGRVRSANGDALSGLEVRIYGTSARLVTDSGGNYRLDDVTPGEITLQVSGGGYMPQQRIITVKPGEVSRQDFRMSHVSASVDVVESLKEYHLEETSLATRTPTRLIDLPQSVQVYPNQLIEDRAILEGNELYRNVSGLNQSTYSAMTFRGFTQRELLFNGAHGNPYGSLDGDVNNSGFSTSQIRLTNIQRVEVLKGPTAAVYGASEPGGLINYVTKQPREVVDGEVQVRVGNFGQKMTSADFGAPIGKHLLARGAFYFEDRDTFRYNSGARNSHAVADLLYKVNDRHRFAAEAEFINQTLSGQRLRGVPVDTAGTFLTNIEWSANEPSDGIKMIGRVLQLRGDHNLHSGWDASYVFRYLQYENNDKYHEPRGLNAATSAGQTMRREYRNYFRANDDWSLVGNLSRSLRTGSVVHRVVLGFDRFDQEHLYRAARAREQEVAGGQVPAIDLFNPAYGLTDGRNYALSAFTLSTGDTSRTGVYGQDQIVFNRYVQALLSGRIDRYNDSGFAGVPLKFEKTAASGRAGLAVKPVENVSLYTSFANSFTRAPLFSQAPGANGPFGPETGWQFEAGAKSELLSRRLFLTGAFFNIDKSNILRPDPALGPAGDNANAVLAVGKARSRGVELNLEGFLTARWYSTFNYAFVDTDILEDNVAALIGRPLANAPRHTVSLFTRYNVLRRTGVSFGVEGVSERVEPFAGIRADSYVVCDVGIYQEVNSWSRLQLQVTNIANRTYALSSLFAARAGNIPGQPRAVMLVYTINPFRR